MLSCYSKNTNDAENEPFLKTLKYKSQPNTTGGGFISNKYTVCAPICGGNKYNM